MSRFTLLVGILFLGCLSPLWGAPQQATLSPLLRVVDLNVGETCEVALCDSTKVHVKLLDLQETRDSIRHAVRIARVQIEIDGQKVWLTSGNYNLPVTAGKAQIDCPITKGPTTNSNGDHWGLEKDARLRLWPAGSPLFLPGRFVYPVEQRWFVSATQMSNEPVFNNAEESPKVRSIYYHYGLDFGGAEILTKVVAATDGLVVSAGTAALPGYADTPVATRYDVIYLLDAQGWYYRYSHLHSFAERVQAGARVKAGQQLGLLGKEGASGGWSHLHLDIFCRQPSGKWGCQDAYAFAWEAYRKQCDPKLVAVARPHHFLAAGETALLDGGKSWSVAGKIVRYQWTFTDGTTAEGPRVERKYARPGYYSEILKVTDSAGRSDYDFAVVVVAQRDRPEQVAPALHVAYWPSLGVRAGDTLTFKARMFGATQGEETWDFGDGTPPAVTRSSRSAEPHAKDGYAVIAHRYERPGDYLVRVERKNDLGWPAIGRVHVPVGANASIPANATATVRVPAKDIAARVGSAGSSSSVMSHTPSVAALLTLLLVPPALSAPAVPVPSITVGDPVQATSLPAALVTAYDHGARDLTIAPGTYQLPAGPKHCIELAGWSNCAIHAKAVTIIFAETNRRPLLLNRCNNVLLEGATLQFAGIPYTQGRVKALGSDAQGKYCDWQIDAGYPTNMVVNKSTFNVVDRQTRLFKPGTGDSDAGEAECRGTGLFRLRQIRGLMAGVAVGDWLVTRAPGGCSIVQLDNCEGCTMRDITLKNTGFAAFFETGGNGGHRYVGCRVARGPRPTGAVEEQLVACGADGFHSVGVRVGPTFEHCVWEGVLLDDCIAIHGTFQKVIRAEGNRLVLEHGNRGSFAVHEPVRVSNDHGFFGQATCVAMRDRPGPDGALELTLDRPLPLPGEGRAGNPQRCGKGYKILDCTLGNTRSRGILVKADNGTIQGCTIEGCGMSAVSIGPEYWWNEADYCWNVTVAGNTLRHNVLNGSGAGVVLVHGDGAVGNRSVTVRDNRFDANDGLFMINVECSDDLTIAGNVIESPSSLATIVNLADSRHIHLQNNVVHNPRSSLGRLVKVGKNVRELSGNGAAGFRIETENTPTGKEKP